MSSSAAVRHSSQASRSASAPAHARHLVQFYETDAFLADAVARFAASGLAHDELVLLIVTAEHGRGALGRLREREVEVDEAIESGRLVIVDADEALELFVDASEPDRAGLEAIVDPVFARAGDRPVRIYGEVVDLLAARGLVDVAVALEDAWNALAATRDFTLLCGYAMSRFRSADDAARFERVCATHAHAIPSDGLADAHDDDERRREICRLQQRAHALEGEIERRRQVEDELRAALRHRDDFLSVASHELRTPVTALRLQLHSLLSAARDGRDARVEDRATRAVGSVDRLVRLVDRLLDVTRITAGRLPLEREEVDFAALVRASIDAADAEIAQSGCEVRLETSGAVRGAWDPLRVEQVVANLLVNASKYGRGAPIDVRVEQVEDRARLVVRDHGRGIAQDEQARIFERFERAAERSAAGLGLGLWIARAIVEEHGGTIAVESAPGEGARFVVELPVSAS